MAHSPPLLYSPSITRLLPPPAHSPLSRYPFPIQEADNALPNTPNPRGSRVSTGGGDHLLFDRQVDGRTEGRRRYGTSKTERGIPFRMRNPKYFGTSALSPFKNTNVTGGARRGKDEAGPARAPVDWRWIGAGGQRARIPRALINLRGSHRP
ncbi:hypothetical protein EVAR_51736_1 [Eumeta japonica]|uniref:Uncharacterized protein n=1 Tax=Eumeta variegata TaxID=151549 RepID=A0A4C1XHY9_EUMVA|nr:hypothetical protein EVAR_51736_1 [Eumeta japonica]